MATLTPTGTRIIDWDGTFFRGMKSDMDPSQLPVGYVWSAMNMLNVGGTMACRPGYRCLVTLPDGNLQGCAIFRPLVGLEQMLVAVDGVVYVSPWPFLEFHALPNVQFSPTASQIFWQNTTQSAERITEDFASAIRVIIPKNVMIMQDGGLSAPAYYDGSTSGHIRNHPFDTPIGGPMAWVGDRLWVGYQNTVQASDIGNPFSFREQIYLGGASAFFFAGEVTALVKTPSIEAPQLMVFTPVDGSILESNIRDRASWPTTPNFQTEVVQVGCHSNRGAITHYGQVVWMTPSGVAFFDPALSGKITTRLPVRDNEMMVSKARMSGNLSGVASAVFGQFVLMSVPAEDTFNRQTWLLNHASLETLSDASGPCWSGYWTGTRPVEWAYGVIADEERIFYVSKDYDGHNRLWEAFQPDRLDNGCPITWAFESRGYFGQTAQVAYKLPGDRCRMAWSDVALVGIDGDIDFGVFYAGGTRGAYRKILNKKIVATKGSLSFDKVLDYNSLVYAFKPQSRVVRTEDANQQSTDVSAGSCNIERPDLDGIDESFQLLFVGQGPAAVRWVRPYAFTVSPDYSGDADACADETGAKVIRFDGYGSQADTAAEATASLDGIPTQQFTSNQTVVVEQGGLSAVGVGFATSIINQRAADRVAKVIATKQAENELRTLLPPVLSVGEGW